MNNNEIWFFAVNILQLLTILLKTRNQQSILTTILTTTDTTTSTLVQQAFKTMNQFVQRVVNYVANEVIIKGLANSKTFQKFAVRTNKQYQDLQKQGTEKLTETFEELAKQQAKDGAAHASASSASTAAGTQKALQPPQRPLRGIPGFFLAFFKEVRKDITGA
jgi:hypothetical protein